MKHARAKNVAGVKRSHAQLVLDDHRLVQLNACHFAHAADNVITREEIVCVLVALLVDFAIVFKQQRHDGSRRRGH